MGTKVQCKSYLSGYHPMRDLNQNTSSSWSSYYEDKTSSGHLYNGFTMQSVNGHSEYDKEIVKRTMLEHEAIFRKQVYELHRLYRTQKDLMDELKMKELLSYSLPRETSQSNSISSQMPFEGAKAKWQMPQAPIVNTFSNGGSVARPSDIRIPQKFLEETSGRPSEPDTKPKRMFDLQLPADVYIDSEDAEQTQREDVYKPSFRATNILNRNRECVPENNVKLTLTSGVDPCRNVLKAEAKSQGDLPTRCLADLNDPVTEACYEGLTGPTSTHLFGTRTQLEEIQGLHSLKSNTKHTGLYRDFFQDIHNDKGTCSKNLCADKAEIRQHWRILDNGAGPSRSMSSFNSGLFTETFPMSYEAIQSKLKKTHEILLPDQNDTETWFKEKPMKGIDISGRRPHLADSNYFGPASSSVSSLFSLTSQMDHQTSASTIAPSSRTALNATNHIPVAVQALPCFNGSTVNLQSRNCDTFIRNSESSCDKWQYNADMRLKPKFGSKGSYQNGFRPTSFTLGKPDLTMTGYESAYGNSDAHGSQKFFKVLQCSDVKSAKDVNLNQILPNGNHGGYIAQPDTVIYDGNINHKESSGGFSWLKTRPSCNGSIDLERHTSGMMFGFSQGYSQSFSTNDTVVPDTQMRCEKEKCFSLHIMKDNSSARGTEEINLNTTMDPVAEKSVGKKPITLVNHINLNLNIPDLSETALEDEANVIPRVAEKIAFEIDLVAPISSRVDDSTLPQGQSTIKTDESHETECSQETVTRAAAENIISLSKDKCFHSNSYSHPSASASCHSDSLHWFAEVVSSNVERARGIIGGSDDEGSDSFEMLALKLEETKMDEYWCRPKEQEIRKDEAKSVASLLMRPRRGQGRRRRQRRDFQKDILPGLVSLSRHEVTEDIQAIGGLMRASGRTLQAGLSRRSSGRKPRGKAAATVETRAAPLTLVPTTNVELDKGDGTNILGWGRTTRRCRRQRCPPGNVTTPLT